MSTETNTPDQSTDVIADYGNELRQLEIDGYESAVRKARTALFVAGALIFVGEMFSMLRAGTGFEPLIFGIALVEAGIFIGLGFWTKSKPYTATVTGLIAFIGFIILSVVVNGLLDGSEGVLKALVSGIIFKVIILINLIRPLKDAKALQDAKEQRF